MIHLALDAAITTGYALIDGPHAGVPSILASGSMRLRGGTSVFRQCVVFLRGLPARPDTVTVEVPVPYYEGGKLRNQKGFATACGIVAIWIDAVSEVWGMRAETVVPSKWQSRIHKGCMGETTKAKSRFFVRGAYKYAVTDDDEADALCIAFWVHLRYGFQLPVSGAGTTKDRIKAAINANIAKHGGDPMSLMLLMEKEKNQ